MRLKIAGTIAILMICLSCGGGGAAGSSADDLRPRTSPVQVGEMAPTFTLEDQNHQKITPASPPGISPTILVFYRGHW